MGAKIRINSDEKTVNETGKYIELRRVWSSGDTIELNIPLEIKPLVSHPLVTNNHSKIAIRRGPLIYCAEAVDNPGIDPREVVIDPESADFKSEWRENLLGGIVVIKAKGYLQNNKVFGNELYKEYKDIRQKLIGQKEISLKLIPYYAWTVSYTHLTLPTN